MSKLSFYPAILKSLMLLLSMLFSQLLLANTLTAEVDRDNIKSDETFTLTLSYNATTNSKPDISDIETQFDILGQRQSSSTNYINGAVSSSTKWVYTLQPQKVGKLMIPSFNFNSSVSDAIVINVEEPTYQSNLSGEDLFFVTEISKKDAYVQEQILLTYKLFHKIQFDVVSHTLSDLDIADTVYEPLENTTYQTTINNERYQVQEINYAFFAQASGSLEIPSIKWVFRTRIGRSSRYEIKRLQTDALQLKIKGVPASFPQGATWLPASELSLTESWSSPFSTLNVGEPSTRTLTLNATGLSEVQLPELTPKSASSAYSVYPEAPTSSQNITRTGITSSREEKSAIVINQAGNIILSEVAIAWWNTQTDTLEYARIEQQSVQVKSSIQTNPTQAVAPALPNSVDTTPQSETTNTNSNRTLEKQIQYKTPFYWPLITVILLLTTAAFFSLWWRLKYGFSVLKQNNNTESNNTNVNQKEIHAFNNIILACKNNDAVESKKALCYWGSTHLNNAQSLAAISAKIQSSDVFNELKSLDEYLYKTEQKSEWQGSKLADALISWKKTQPKKENDIGLAPLYPA